MKDRRVLTSVNSPDGVHCIDIFLRADGSHGFELCRRDPEDGHGWRLTGRHGHRRFRTETQARCACVELYPWVGG